MSLSLLKWNVILCGVNDGTSNMSLKKLHKKFPKGFFLRKEEMLSI